VSAKPVRIAVHGATGRMGQAVLRAALARADCAIGAALVRPDSPLAGEPLATLFGANAPDVDFTAALAPEAQPDVLIDFTGARAFDGALALARARGCS
jgi:4-hydroxy-tetrahydrodipicolinate reductase